MIMILSCFPKIHKIWDATRMIRKLKVVCLPCKLGSTDATQYNAAVVFRVL